MPTQNNKIDTRYLRENCANLWSEINVFEQIDSTNSWLKDKNNFPIACLAETQTQGRGRNGSQWLSPDAQNIYLSFNWVFESQPRHFQLLSLWIGIVIAETVASLGIKNHGIKWPNDLFWMNKKVGGILIETNSASSEVIVGIGINANVSIMDTIDQPWTSLSEIYGEDIDRNKFLVKLLSALYAAMQTFPMITTDELLIRWSKWDLIKGKTISFLQNGETCEGVAQGIDHSGHLLVKVSSKETRAFNTSISQVRWQ